MRCYPKGGSPKTDKHFFEVLPLQLFLRGCSPSGCFPATDGRRRWGKLAVSFCTRPLTECGAPLAHALKSLKMILLVISDVLLYGIFLRCASISCTDDRMSLIETADWQSLMFDSYFTIRLVQSRL